MRPSACDGDRNRNAHRGLSEPLRILRRLSGWRGLFGLVWCTGLLLHAGAAERRVPDVLVIVGAAGEPSFAPGFAEAAEAWREAAEKSGARVTVVGDAFAGETKRVPGATAAVPAPEQAPSAEAPDVGGAAAVDDRARIRGFVTTLPADTDAPAWIVYLGHGTFDRKQAWLNLRGPDLSAAEFADLLRPLHSRPLIFVHGGSASGPFLPLLSGPERIVITATRSGDEMNYARFGENFARAVASLDADINQDGTTSLLEAYLTASKTVQAHYSENGKLATEHALLDDNGDGLGTPAEWFQGVRVVKRPDNKTAEPDGFRAHQIALVEPPSSAALTPEQREMRDAQERALEALRARRERMPEEEYLREVEQIVRTLAPLYQASRDTVPRSE